jgi:hypothetical protein
MTTYNATPKPKDKPKANLYSKQTTNKCLNTKHTKNSQNTTKTPILATINNNYNYIKETAQNLQLYDQTIKNHLKQQNPTQIYK